ncbi:hypothetical protein [Clostridium intestinale]|uniref:Uncharacterized protein n=1 Tax=Clostridium intestinale URNW TaxID=1294142 RepID=U2N5Y8_9CLOT|nr:hypothetical protein [Clostridium intestinale]ERK30922.1 hypothetical protein CINTURNW_1908 [Clostridium intestinale URNW]
MRFLLEFKDYKTKEVENGTINLLDTYLNEHTIDSSCGDTFDMIVIRFLNNASSKRVERESKLYNFFALIEVNSSFQKQGKIDILEFQDAFRKVRNSIERVEKIKIDNMDFNLEKLTELLRVAEHNLPKSKKELEEYKEKQVQIKLNNKLRLVNFNIKKDEEIKRELDKPLTGIRVYSELRFEGVDLEPYVFMYENIFSNLLRKEKIMLPGYSEIYLYIHKTLDDAKINASHPAAWSKNTYGEIDLEKYKSSTEEDKAKMVFDSVCQGLRLICDFNHLDKAAIERVIKVVEKEGIETELEYIKKENKNYMVKLIYVLSKIVKRKALLKLMIKDKITGKEGYAEIGYINLWYGPCINKIRIAKKKIIIEGEKNLRAEISRSNDNIEDKYVFSIDQILL